MTIKERNALDLKKAWKKFIKKQEAKHGHKTAIGNVKERPEALDEGTATHSTGLLRQHVC